MPKLQKNIYNVIFYYKKYKSTYHSHGRFDIYNFNKLYHLCKFM